jgi:hypothetical protein
MIFMTMHLTLPVEVNDADPAKLAELANTAKSGRPVCKLIKGRPHARRRAYRMVPNTKFLFQMVMSFISGKE